MEKIYDIIIIGAGPAGLSAGLYASRSKLEVLILEKKAVGGQIVITDEVENYPGAEKNSTGPSLIKRMKEQTLSFGAKIEKENVIGVEFKNKIKTLNCESNIYKAKSIIVANGGKPKLIGCKGEKELTGKGVSYCATCDGAFFEELEVFVIGGGDSAVEEAIYLTKFAKKVTVVHRRDELRANKSLSQKAFKNNKIHFLWDTVVEEIKGDGIVESIIFKNVKTNKTFEHFANEDEGTFGVFPFIGFDPVSSLYNNILKMENNYIITDDDMKTNIDGIFAAGDIRVKSLRQVVTATADGAIAATSCEKYINELN